MDNLCLEEGGQVELRLKTNIPKAKAVTFKPTHYSFSELPTPRETLEYALSKFTVLTEEDTITITHGSSKYPLKVTKVSPKTDGTAHPAVELLEAHVEVEFEEAEEKGPDQQQEAPTLVHTLFGVDTNIKSRFSPIVFNFNNLLTIFTHN